MKANRTRLNGLEAARLLYAPPDAAPASDVLPPPVVRELSIALAFAAGFFRPDNPEDVDEAFARGEAARLRGHPTHTREGELRDCYHRDAARRHGNRDGR